MKLEDVIAHLEQENRKHLEQKLEAARKTAEALEKLRAAGLVEIEIDTWNYNYVNLSIVPADGTGYFKDTKKHKKELLASLNKYRKALGETLTLRHKDISNAKKGLINLTVGAKSYPHVTIRYRRKIKRTGSRCRIVKQRVSYVNETLVCDT